MARTEGGRWRLLRAVAMACLLLVVSACSSSPGTGDKGYVTGEGAIQEIPVADRGDPVTLSGQALDGSELSLDSLRGRPAVVVVWGSWCPPCRAEAPVVVSAAREYGDRVGFVGINIRDASTDQGRAFERTFEVPYPSFYSPDGVALLSFPGTLGPNSIPSTVVLDDQGRVAAAVVGPLPSELTLTELIDRVLEDG